MSVSVSMPQLGESVTEGTVTRWLKREGEHVQADEPLLEVSTDKVDTEIPSPVSGVLRGITVAEDETVAVGAELAVIDEDGAGGQPAAEPQAAPEPEAAPEPQAAPQPQAAPEPQAAAPQPLHPIAPAAGAAAPFEAGPKWRPRGQAPAPPARRTGAAAGSQQAADRPALPARADTRPAAQ